MSDLVIGVVGNPNCGKTSLFNALTGAKQYVGNWPGVTVERKLGEYRHAGKTIEVVDLPGIYSLDTHAGDASLDERIARDFILSHDADLIVNIVDASNFERNLYLTAQLLEMRVPMLLALNMVDVAVTRGISIDAAELAERLGCPVVSTVARKGEGVELLKSAVDAAVRDQPIPQAEIRYPQSIDKGVQALTAVAGSRIGRRDVEPAWLAMKLLEGDELALAAVSPEVRAEVEAVSRAIEDEAGEEPDILVADARYGFIHEVAGEVMLRAGTVRRSVSDAIDRVVLNRVMGIPIFLGVMYLMFMFTINVGGAFIDFFDGLAGTVLVEGAGAWLNGLGSPEWVVTLLAGGVGGGIQVVATFIPIIGFLYLFLSALEDSGYMARGAFVMDRFMRTIGLPGKSFVPMIVGFGCNVPAIMATRTLESPRDRVLTILMNPFMSCGARLPVYALFAAAFFPVGGQNLVFGLYIIGIAMAVLTGYVMKHTLLPGEGSHFIMELPRYHVPTFKSVGLRAWDRLKSFMFRAGKVIVPMVIVINFMNAVGTDGSFGNENSDRSVLSTVGRTLTPAFAPMGLEEDNWPATVGIFTGVLAKEVVVGTLDAIYGQLAEADALAAGGTLEAEAEFDFWGGLSAAVASVPENLAGVADAVLDPLGIGIGDVSSVEAAAAEQEVAAGTFGAMAARFDGEAGAFAYLLFILMYFPCVAATAAIYRETSLGWAAFVGAWTTGLAYATATMFYQAATFSAHPTSSAAWIVGLALSFVAVIAGLRQSARRSPPTVLAAGGA